MTAEEMRKRGCSRLLVGMSGGLDSTYTAYRLKEEGFFTAGVFLRMTEESDAAEAERAAKEVGIPLYVLDARADFSRCVQEPFADSYASGETPNPCVECNRYVKVEMLCRFARENGFDHVVTGHYAEICYDGGNGRYFVRRGAEHRKDQSYMLWKLTQEQLSMLVTPLSDENKADIRMKAEQIGISAAASKESQDICFLPDGDYAAFVEGRRGRFPEGNFVDENGTIVGRHKGIIHYTVGQRKGLGIALGKPVFVTKIDAAANTVHLAPAGQEYADTVFLRGLEFQKLTPQGLAAGTEIRTKVRYAAEPTEGKVISFDGERCGIRFEKPVRAVTPGQSAVCYGIGEEDEDILFGGIITAV